MVQSCNPRATDKDAMKTVMVIDFSLTLGEYVGFQDTEKECESNAIEELNRYRRRANQ